MLVFTEQLNDSTMHTILNHVSPLFWFFSPFRSPQWIKENLGQVLKPGISDAARFCRPLPMLFMPSCTCESGHPRNPGVECGKYSSFFSAICFLTVFFLSSSPLPPEFLFNLYSFSALLPLTWLHFSLLSRYIFKGSFNSCTTTGFCNSPVVEEHTVFGPIYLWKKLMCRDVPWFCLAPRQYQHWVPRCTGTGRTLVPFTDLKPW